MPGLDDVLLGQVAGERIVELRRAGAYSSGTFSQTSPHFALSACSDTASRNLLPIRNWLALEFSHASLVPWSVSGAARAAAAAAVATRVPLLGLLFFGAISAYLPGCDKKNLISHLPKSNRKLRRTGACYAKTCEKARTSVTRSSRHLPEVSPEFASGRESSEWSLNFLSHDPRRQGFRFI